MVLKKSKGSLAGTGNTVRKGGRQSMQRALKAACITKRTWNRDDLDQRDELFDGKEAWYGDAALSLNKKNRWLITEELEERCERYNEHSAKENLFDDSKAKQHPKRKCSKKQKKAEEYIIEKKTKVIEKTFLSRSTECRAVYDSIGDDHSIKKGKSWKSQRDDRGDGDYHAVYEITSGMPSHTWPLHITSRWRHDDKLYGDWRQISTQSTYKGKACSNNRKRITSTELVTDAVELMDCSDYEEDTDLPDAEAPFLADRTTVQDTYQLLDFIVMTTDKKKHSKPGRKKPHWCTDVLTLDVEEDKDRDIIYVDKEDYQIQVESEQHDNQPVAQQSENTDKNTDKNTELTNIGQTVSQALDGFREIELSVETNTVTKASLAKLYGRGYFEGRSNPRKFGILLNLCFDEREMSTGKKCFIIAEQISTDNVRNQTTLKVKLIGNEKAVAQLANYIDRSGAQAFQCLNGQKEMLQHANVPARIETMRPPIPEYLQNLTKWNPRCFPAHEAFDFLAGDLFFERDNEDIDSDAEETYDDIEIVTLQCSICFEDLVNPSVDVSTMQLHSCLHTFCRDCWMLYLYQMIRDQKHIIICPELGCTETVDTVTLLSLLDHKLAQFYLKNKFEHFLARKTDWQWCPGCERLGSCPGYQPLQNKPKICDTPVMKCGCYKTWCFECQENQHWPINCEDMKSYKAIFEENASKLFNEFGKIYETNVQVKHCPSCRTPIEKNRGCPHMVCRCGKAFCWICTRTQCADSRCQEVAAKTITFTSVDDLSNKGANKAMKKALQFSYLKKQLGVRKTKLGIAKQSTSIDKRHPNNSLMGMIRNVIADMDNVCSVLENIAATGCTSQSKHFKDKLYKFTDLMEVMISNLNEALMRDHVTNVNMKEVITTAVHIKENLVRFITVQLGKNT